MSIYLTKNSSNSYDYSDPCTALIVFCNSIIFLLALEQRARSRQKFFDATKSYKSLNPRSLPLSLGLACTIFCLIPIIVGFAIPVTILATFVFRGLAITNFDLLISASLNSIMIALASALVVVLLAFVMVSTTVYRKKRYLNILSNISAMGYAFPGAILAIGVVSFGGWIDSGLEYLDDTDAIIVLFFLLVTFVLL